MGIEINSNDYHDYVFKDGKLIGEFEQMYQKSSVTPWHQGEAQGKWFNQVSLAIAGRALEDKAVKNILEVGCGLGFFLSSFLGMGINLTGTDISPTAISQAKQKFPNINFIVDDIRCKRNRDVYDMILISALFWYIFDHIDIVLDNLAKLTRPNGWLFVVESFPLLDKQFVGKKVIPNPDILVTYLSKSFETVVDGRIMKSEYPDDGPNLYWLGKKK